MYLLPLTPVFFIFQDANIFNKTNGKTDLIYCEAQLCHDRSEYILCVTDTLKVQRIRKYTFTSMAMSTAKEFHI